MTHVDGSPAAYAAASPYKFHNLVVAAAVFHDNRLLIIKRSAEERSWTGYWEMPGGSVDSTDETISDAIARELREETGLVMRRVVDEIQPPITFDSGWAKSRKWLKLSFLVEITESAEAEAEEEVKAQESEEGKAKSISRVGVPIVKLDPKEHQSHLWVTEAQILAAKHQDTELEFISEEQVHVMLTAFGIHRRREQESSGTAV
ncbi:hypothetical protein MBLNU459_g6531t2 [Dothideomycetes sp. NU459]